MCSTCCDLGAVCFFLFNEDTTVCDRFNSQSHTAAFHHEGVSAPLTEVVCQRLILEWFLSKICSLRYVLHCTRWCKQLCVLDRSYLFSNHKEEQRVALL